MKLSRIDGKLTLLGKNQSVRLMLEKFAKEQGKREISAYWKFDIPGSNRDGGDVPLGNKQRWFV